MDPLWFVYVHNTALMTSLGGDRPLYTSSPVAYVDMYIIVSGIILKLPLLIILVRNNRKYDCV